MNSGKPTSRAVQCQPVSRSQPASFSSAADNWVLGRALAGSGKSFGKFCCLYCDAKTLRGNQRTQTMKMIELPVPPDEQHGHSS